MDPARSAGSILLALAALLVLGASTAAADPRGVFVARCDFSHSLPDDPILHPGEPGASHRHDFFGNITTNAMSTVADMVDGETTCALSTDTAGYWFPSASLGGAPLRSTFAKVYYFGVPRASVEPMPRGLQIVAGNAAATSTADNPNVTWSCGAKGRRRTPIVDHPYDCTRLASRWDFVDSVVARVDLPTCWDGVGLAPADVTYLVDGSCPAGFEHRLPGLRMQVHVGVLNPCPAGLGCRSGGTGGNVALMLSSGAFFTFHADLWNTWHQRALERLIERCLDAHVRCGNVADP